MAFPKLIPFFFSILTSCLITSGYNLVLFQEGSYL
jgi:hypothetical protein